jgi:hypothetical protein
MELSAQVIASLNHLDIAIVYGFGHADAIHASVMGWSMDWRWPTALPKDTL